MHWVLGHRRSAGVLLLVAGAWWLSVTRIVIPAIAGKGYTYAGVLPHDPVPALHNVAAAVLFPGLLTLTVLTSVAMLGRWSLMSPIALGIVPYLGALALVDNFRYHTFYYHYFLLPTIILAAAGIDAAGRHRPECRVLTGRRMTSLMLALAILAGPMTVALARVHWSQRDSIAQSIAQIPSGTRVAADPAFTAQLATRTEVSQVRPPDFVDGSGRPMVDVEWVVLDQRTTAFGGPGWVEPMLAELARLGYHVASQQGSVIVLTRGS